MEASGAILREVGTTNRTHARDYRRAIADRTSLILKVHPSNYEVVGFATSPTLDDLIAIAHEAGIPLLYDVGSGLLAPGPETLAGEPDARSAIEVGADLVCFSGDKLLGGPQAGVLAGRRDLVEMCRRHPIARAVRADKLTLAAMEATLWAHATGRRTEIPAWRMLETPAEEIGARAAVVATALPPDVDASLIDGESVTGGGALPGRSIPTMLISIRHAKPEAVAAALRAHDPPVIARVERGALLVDLRTVAADDDAVVIASLRLALGS
jgi:L-seryl-tRNA(Ser) seleniumtransferase